MNLKSLQATLCSALCLLLIPDPTLAVEGWATIRVRETLNRGVHAQHLGTAAYINWHLLETDGVNTAFNVYRRVGAAIPVLLNATPITQTTDFVDPSAPTGVDVFYHVKAVVNGRVLAQSVEAKVNSTTSKDYVSINVGVGFGKVGVGDLDGDGSYDFVIRTPQGSIDPEGPYDGTGAWHKSGATYKLKAFKSDGSAMWTHDLGWNIEGGVWYSPFIVYDFDGDGKAEIAAKTAPLSPDYRNTSGIIGRVDNGPEELSIINGMTGQIVHSIPWPDRTNFESYNHLSRNQIGVAYLDGRTPCIIAGRGTYVLLKAMAAQYTNGQLSVLWNWNSASETRPGQWNEQGAHSMHAADVDGDGRDEVVLGSATLDDTGVGLWTNGLDHCDHAYVGDLDPNRSGLEIYFGYEDGRPGGRGVSMWNARTGTVIWGIPESTTHIHDEGLVADLDPLYPGVEMISREQSGDVEYYHTAGGPSPYGQRLSHKGLFFDKRRVYHAAYWDADLQREAIVRDTLYSFPTTDVTRIYYEPLTSSAVSAWILTSTDNKATKAYFESNSTAGIRLQQTGTGEWKLRPPAPIPVTAGKKYRLLSYCRINSGINTVTLRLQAYNGSTLVSENILDASPTMIGVEPNKEIAGTFTVQQGVTGVVPQFVGNYVGTFEVDDVNIIQDDQNVARAHTMIQGTDFAWADLYGDWREEIITSYGTELRIYSTRIPAQDRRVTLMQDPIYRADVAHVAMGYEQTPTPSYVLAQPTGQNKIAISPSADAMVRGGTNAGVNYGTNVQLAARNADGTNNDLRSYLRFDLGYVPAGRGIAKATLRLWVTASQNPVNSVHLVPNETWTEIGIKWENMPAYSSPALDSKTLPSGGRWIEFNVTSAAQSELNGDGLLSLAIVSNASGDCAFSSSEGGNPPHLLIETSVDSHATLAHWRFEPSGFLDDSSGDSHTLLSSGTAPSAVLRPASGAGSKFSDPLPQTEAVNQQLSNFGTTQSGNFYTADTGGWMDSISTRGEFTVEALANVAATYSANMFIASQWLGTSGQRSFVFGVDTNRKLVAVLSADGNNTITVISNITLELGKDYYVAMSFDAANKTSGVTFYARNLTDGGVLQSHSLPHTLNGIRNSSASIAIGSYNNNASDRRWKGLIDEVRISDSVLPPTSLLISLP